MNRKQDVVKQRYWRRTIGKAARSGMSIREFCRERRLKESVLLVAAQTERGWGERKVEDLTRGGAWLGKQRQARSLFDSHVQRLKITLAEQAGAGRRRDSKLNLSALKGEDS
jgi:hypothetical protein